ncbi:MAG: 5' nucleotidase, NT5C type [Anaerolineae bacterium]
MKPIVGVDICNTIAEVNKEIGRIFGIREWRPSVYSMEKFGIVGKEREEFFLRNMQVFERAEPVEASVEALKALSRRYRIVYISSRPPEARDVTEWWLKEHGFPPGLLVLGKDKVLAARNLGVGAFVEDAPHEIERLSKVCRVIPVGWEYNGSTLHWKEIRRILEHVLSTGGKAHDRAP